MDCPNCKKPLKIMYTDERGKFIVDHYVTCECGCTVNQRRLKRKVRKM